MRFREDFPIKINQKFRRILIENFRKLQRFYNVFSIKFKEHKTSEKNAHKANQINYKGRDLESEISDIREHFDNLVIDNNGDGIAEVSDARVDYNSKKEKTLSRRLENDYKSLLKKITNNNEDLEKSKIFKSATDFDGVYINENKSSSKGLQSWLDWNNERGGGVLVLPAGVYYISERLVIHENTTILGYGATIRRNNNSNGWFTNLVKGQSPIKYEGNSNIAFIGVTFDGNYKVDKGMNGNVFAHSEKLTFKECTFLDVHSTHALDLNGCKDVLVSHCLFKGQKNPLDNNKEAIQVSIAAKIGIGDIEGSSYDSTPSKNVVVENCYFGPSENNDSYATAVGDHFSVYDKWVSSVVIRNNFIEGTSNFAIRPYKFKDIIVDGNIIENCKGGIYGSPTPGGYTSSNNASGEQMGAAQKGENLKIINNTFKNISDLGIHITSYPNKKIPNQNESYDMVQIHNNTFFKLEGVAIYAPEVKRLSVSNNTIFKCSMGIQCYGTWHLSVTNNMVHTAETIGIFISNNKKLEEGSVQQHAIVSGNQVYSTGQDGIRVSLGAKFIKVTNNSVHSFGLDFTEDWHIAGIYMVECKDSVITDNLIRNADEKEVDGIRVSDDCENVRVFNIDTGGSKIVIVDEDNGNFYGIKDKDGKKVKF